MSIACLEDTGESSRYVRKSRISKYTSVAVPFHVGAYFCMGAYKRDVVVVIEMGSYIHRVLILCRCLLSRFYSTAVERAKGVTMVTMETPLDPSLSTL